MKYWLVGTAFVNFRDRYVREKFDSYDAAIDRACELDMKPDDFDIEYEY